MSPECTRCLKMRTFECVSMYTLNSIWLVYPLLQPVMKMLRLAKADVPHMPLFALVCTPLPPNSFSMCLWEMMELEVPFKDAKSLKSFR